MKSSESKMRKHSKLASIDNQLLLLPGNKLSKLIKDGSLTAAKLCELYSERIKRVQPVVNAMAQERFREALDEARSIDQLLADFRAGKPESEFGPEQLEMLRSPLLGVPISIKESIMVRGMRNSCGLWSRREVNATCDAVAVSNARRFGLIPICTTNIPECTLYWADCNNKVYGRTRNPYDPSRVSGASSGGEGALIGAAGSLLGLGSDIGGSLRLPAHYCGIFSHKASPFLISAEGNYPELIESRLRLFTLGPMCRYASDLRPLLKCLMSDKDNQKQDTYFKFQPENIGRMRAELAQKLDEQPDLSQIKIFHFKFNQESKLKGRHSVRVQKEIMEAQQEVLDHLSSKFNLQVEHVNLDKFLRKTMITLQCMLRSGGTVDRDTSFVENEVENLFGINSMTVELLKMPLGLSKHTLESLLAILMGMAVPNERAKAFALCERFEKLAAELKADMDRILGDSGVLIMPTLPTVAYKHNVPLLKSLDLRFTAIFNILQLPVTHATLRLNKKNRLPFGFSLASRAYNDHLTIALAEELEQAFGGWQEPNPSGSVLADVTPLDSKTDSSVPIKTSELVSA